MLFDRFENFEVLPLLLIDKFCLLEKMCKLSVAVLQKVEWAFIASLLMLCRFDSE